MTSPPVSPKNNNITMVPSSGNSVGSNGGETNNNSNGPINNNNSSNSSNNSRMNPNRVGKTVLIILTVIFVLSSCLLFGISTRHHQSGTLYSDKSSGDIADVTASMDSPGSGFAQHSGSASSSSNNNGSGRSSGSGMSNGMSSGMISRTSAGKKNQISPVLVESNKSIRPLMANNPSIPNYASVVTTTEQERKDEANDASSDDSSEDSGAETDTGTSTSTSTNPNSDKTTKFHMYSYKEHHIPGKHGSGGNSLPEPSSAAEALECRSSVLEFVINATDVKDECEGLRKAFDTTCSSHPSTATSSSSSLSNAAEGGGVGGGTTGSISQEGGLGNSEYTSGGGDLPRRRSQRRKLLYIQNHDDEYNQEEAYTWETWCAWMSKRLYRGIRKLWNRWDRNEMLLFLDENIIAQETWGEASKQVKLGLDETDEYRLLEMEMMSGYIPDTKKMETESESFERRLENDETNDANTTKSLEDEEEDPDFVKMRSKESSSEKKHKSPSIPTSSEHIQSQMLNDAFSLNEELSEEAISKVIDTLNESKNKTLAKSEARSRGPGSGSSDTVNAANDAEISSEAISAATAVVSAVLNSPTSIEARTCCASIMNVFHEECESSDDDEYNDRRLIVIVSVIALCGIVKSLIRHFQIRWLPEAGGCILVGAFGGFFLQFLPNFDFGFHHDLFLRVMVPPIVFEAALNIDKRSFMRVSVPIVIYAVAGTLLSSLVTAAIIYYGTAALGGWSTHIPFIESLIFGALISSIDPIAVLSVLSNMGMSDKDTIYIVIFGESLLNDGVSIVLFQTLVHFLDSSLIIDGQVVLNAFMHFLVIFVGSLAFGVLSGACATVYFWMMKGIQTPLVEVLMFLCWAFIPYYICDGIEWSGIVTIVTAGFFMDIYVVGSRIDHNIVVDSLSIPARNDSVLEDVNVYPQKSLLKRIFSQEGFLSPTAKRHIGFVTRLIPPLWKLPFLPTLGSSSSTNVIIGLFGSL